MRAHSICLIALAAVLGPAAAQEIALVNPGFETPAEDDPTMAAGWQRWQAGREQIWLDDEGALEGQRCAAVATNLPGRGAVVLKQYFSDYQPGQTYEVVFAGRTNGVTAGRLQVINETALRGGQGREQIYPGERLTFDNTQWQQLATTFIGPGPPGERLYLELSHADSGAQGAVVWWDDFSVRPLLPMHDALLEETRERDRELFAVLVNTRYAVGSRCDMLGWRLDDAIEAGAIERAAAGPIRAEALEIADAMEALVADWHQRHEEVFGESIALTRLDEDAVAERRAALAATVREGQEALSEARERWEARLDALEEQAADAMGEFEVEPALSADMAPDVLGDRFHRIISWHGFMDDVDYVQRAMWSIGTTVVQAYRWREDARPLRRKFLEENRPRTLATVCALPRDGWPDLTSALEGASRDVTEIGELPGYCGAEIDEPSISDEHVTTPEAEEQFRGWLRGRYDEAALRELGLPEDPAEWSLPERVESDADRVLWMEVQQFKRVMLAERLDRLEAHITELGEDLVLLPVVQQFIPSAPQRASWTAVGPVVNWLGMDPYNGGNLSEAFQMDLLRSAAAGPTALVVGTCYDPTAGRFYKDMCISLGHADGLWLWCWVYMSKYRAPGYLRDWEPTYRHLWKPGMWEAAQEVFGRIAAAEQWLVHTDSAAEVSVVYSERTGIANSRENFGYFSSNLGLYQALQQSHIAQEAVFVETLTPEALQARKVMLLDDARCLTDGEVAVIREWVRDGGALIAFGATSLWDAWGRTRDDYALADVFGVRHVGEAPDVESITPSEPLKALAPGLPDTVACPSGAADLVEPTTASVLATLPGGEPAITRNTFGEGVCYLVTPRQFCLGFDGSKSTKGLYKHYWPGVRETIAGLTLSALTDAGGSQWVTVEGCPEDTELALRRQGDRVIAHLLNYHDDGPVDGVTLRIEEPRPSRVFLGDRPGEDLQIATVGDVVTVEVPTFEHCAMVVIEQGPR